MRKLTVTCDMCAADVDVTATPEEPVVTIGFGADPPLICGNCAGKAPKRTRFKRKVLAEVERVTDERLDDLALKYDEWVRGQHDRH